MTDDKPSAEAVAKVKHLLLEMPYSRSVEKAIAREFDRIDKVARELINCGSDEIGHMRRQLRSIMLPDPIKTPEERLREVLPSTFEAWDRSAIAEAVARWNDRAGLELRVKETGGE